MTTPKVIEINKSLFGKSPGRLSARTMGSPPRSPPQTRMMLHARGIRSRLPRNIIEALKTIRALTAVTTR